MTNIELAAMHPDDMAVDAFAAAMKDKLAEKRAQGYHGWDDRTDCPPGRLARLLHEHLSKGDPLDVGNFAMMLWNRGESCAAPAREISEQQLIDMFQQYLEDHRDDGRQISPRTGKPGYDECEWDAFVYAARAVLAAFKGKRND